MNVYLNDGLDLSFYVSQLMDKVRRQRKNVPEDPFRKTREIAKGWVDDPETVINFFKARGLGSDREVLDRYYGEYLALSEEWDRCRWRRVDGRQNVNFDIEKAKDIEARMDRFRKALDESPDAKEFEQIKQRKWTEPIDWKDAPSECPGEFAEVDYVDIEKAPIVKKTSKRVYVAKSNGSQYAGNYSIDRSAFETGEGVWSGRACIRPWTDDSVDAWASRQFHDSECHASWTWHADLIFKTPREGSLFSFVTDEEVHRWMCRQLDAQFPTNLRSCVAILTADDDVEMGRRAAAALEYLERLNWLFDHLRPNAGRVPGFAEREREVRRFEAEYAKADASGRLTDCIRAKEEHDRAEHEQYLKDWSSGRLTLRKAPGAAGSGA